jgi:hypothetical protein
MAGAFAPAIFVVRTSHEILNIISAGWLEMDGKSRKNASVRVAFVAF